MRACLTACLRSQGPAWNPGTKWRWQSVSLGVQHGDSAPAKCAAGTVTEA